MEKTNEGRWKTTNGGRWKMTNEGRWKTCYEWIFFLSIK